ncbi:hypothetical protein [Pacificispira spongiicola]
MGTARDVVTNLQDVKPAAIRGGARPSRVQMAYLRRGLEQPGGKLPLFDAAGQRISDRTVRSCIEQGWAEPWFNNPLKPDWLVCKLTDAGRMVADTGDDEGSDETHP